MLLSIQKKIISIAVPKAGSTTIYYALMDSLNEEFFFDNQAPALYHIYASDIKKILGRKAWNEFYSFGIARNPYSRAVSLYNDFKNQRNIIKAQSFEIFVLEKLEKNWIRNVHFHPQNFFLFDKNKQKEVTSIYKFEDGMQNIFDAVAEKNSLRKVSVGHARDGGLKNIKTYYQNPSVIERINILYQDDFELLDYKFLTETDFK